VTRVATLKAAFKAYVFNKISDVFFFLFVLVIFLTVYDIDVLTINNQTTKLAAFKICFLSFEINLTEFLTFLITSCAFIKSAQIGAHL
jgi:NADH:ubiquinone oxidoreductase subunit 5 (subunit L)/multisubunit Na+/H+ antiporter MnhA subunit